ncbi:MAG: ribosome small subunit-dependent GTPase A [Clostridia bacterium]|nr:ribosome small subunit-dependent GTPase A [Clostridia bacterium]
MQGLIIGNIANLYKIKVENKIYEAVARGKLKKEEMTPVVGDKVEINIIDKENLKATIEEIKTRETYIKRPKIANVTQVILMISTKNPKPDLLMLDKQLVYAELLKIEPIIIINKIDLDEETSKEIEDTYKKIGYKVYTTIAKENETVEKIKTDLKGKISVFAGNSGVGKSTTINALFRDNITEEGEISTKNKRGKNTTTDVKLYELDENTYIADTPGFSTFEITEIESKELDQYFREFKEEIGKCEYIGCTHIKEQKCGIKEAIKQGKISQERYDRFCKIYQELKDKEARKW